MQSVLIQDLEHAYASAVKDFITVQSNAKHLAEDVKDGVEKLAAFAEKESPAVVGAVQLMIPVVGLVDPNLDPMLRVASAWLGKLLAAVQAAGPAAQANGLSVTADAALLNDVSALGSRLSTSPAVQGLLAAAPATVTSTK